MANKSKSNGNTDMPGSEAKVGAKNNGKQNGDAWTEGKKKAELVPPDGGWGWMIVLSSGLSTMCTLCYFQQFGLLFRKRFESATAITAIANTSVTVTSCVGLLNGPLFRKFSYRQVAVVGAILSTLGTLMAVFSNALWMYIVSISVLYGIGMGWLACSNMMAMNSYFKKRRRLATSLQWTLTGLGPIIMPLIITGLNSEYGDSGTLLIFCGITMQSLVFALLLQPVEWHAKKTETDPEIVEKADENEANDNKDKVYFGSKTSIYTFDEDDPKCPGYQVSEPVTMLTKSNDSYSSKINLKHTDDTVTRKRDLRHSISEIQRSKPDEMEPLNAKADEVLPPQLTCKEKFVKFFDLDLLRDKVFINIMIGLTMTNFNESNFAMMTPFILKDFNFELKNIAFVMSTLGGIDVGCRLCVPIVAKYIKFSNRVFLIFGMMLTATGRTILAFDHSSITIGVVLVIIGIGKGFRTVFNSLVIPTHVSLEKLPGASGLQLVTNCIYSLMFGPLIGYLRDAYSSTVLLHALNITTFLTFISWTIEMCYMKYKAKQNPECIKT